MANKGEDVPYEKVGDVFFSPIHRDLFQTGLLFGTLY